MLPCYRLSQLSLLDCWKSLLGFSNVYDDRGLFLRDLPFVSASTWVHEQIGNTRIQVQGLRVCPVSTAHAELLACDPYLVKNAILFSFHVLLFLPKAILRMGAGEMTLPWEYILSEVSASKWEKTLSKALCCKHILVPHICLYLTPWNWSPNMMNQEIDSWGKICL
jgi:hypothetical protein